MKLLTLILLALIASIANAESFEVNCGETKCAVYALDLSVTSLDLLDRDEDGTRFRNAEGIERWASKKGKRLIFATNSGIFDKTFLPLGLFIKNGKQIVPINTSDGEGNFFKKPNGIFYVSNSEGHIVETSRYKPNGEVAMATQSGPLLLQDGVINPIFQPESKNKKIRSGVGVLNNRKVYFAISNSDISFFDFASLFKENLKCSDALYLDGGISRAFIPEIGRNQRDGDFAALFVVFERQHNN